MSRDRYAIALNKPVPDAPPITVLEDVKTGDPELTVAIKLLRPKAGDMLFVQVQSPVTAVKLQEIYEIVNKVNDCEFPRESIFTMVFNRIEMDINLISDEDLKNMGFQRIKE